ncbi:MAG: hypothetical protein DRO40_03505 [Thermoprotei archaeon]|nr:MAG: hypothetical protein DRO40_03505 [Thermoprotei archaeon]
MLRSMSAYPLAIMLTISLITITVVTINSMAKISTLTTSINEKEKTTPITYYLYNDSLYIIPIKRYSGSIRIIAIDEHGYIDVLELNRSLLKNKIAYGPIPLYYKYLIIQNEDHVILDVLGELDSKSINMEFLHPLPPSLYVHPALSVVDYIDQHSGINNYYEVVPKINDIIENILYPNLTYKIDNELYKPTAINQSIQIKTNSSKYYSPNDTFLINITNILMHGTQYYGGYLVRIEINSTKPLEFVEGLSDNYTHHKQVYPRNTETIEVVETHTLLNKTVDSGYITDILINATHEILNASIIGLWSGRVVAAFYEITYNLTLTNGSSSTSYIVRTNTTSININNYTMIINKMFNNISYSSSNSSIKAILIIRYNIVPIEIGSEPLLLDLYSHIHGNIQNRSLRIIRHNTLQLITDDIENFIVDRNSILIYSTMYSLKNNISYRILTNNSILDRGNNLHILLNFYGRANISITEYALPDIVINDNGIILTNIVNNATISGNMSGILWFNTNEKPLHIRYKVPSIVKIGIVQLYISTYSVLLRDYYENKTYIYNGTFYLVNGSKIRFIQNVIILRNITYAQPYIYFPCTINLTMYIGYTDGQMEIINTSYGKPLYRLRNMLIRNITVKLNHYGSRIYGSLNTPFLFINFRNTTDYAFIEKDMLRHINIFGNIIVIYRTRIYGYEVSLLLSPTPPFIKYPEPILG